MLAPLLAVAQPLVEKTLIDNVVLARRLDLLGGVALLFAALWLLSTLNWIVANALRSYLAERFALLLRQRLFAHSGALSLAFARREHSAQTTSLFVNDVPSLTGLFSTTVIDGISGLMVVIVGTAVMVRLNWQLALAVGFGTIFVGVVSTAVTRPLRPAARRVQEMAAQVVERIQEHLAGIREVVAFGQVQRQEQQFTSALQDLLRLRMRLTFLDTGIQSGASIVSLGVMLAILMYGSYLVIEGKTTLGTVIAMRSLFGLLSQPAGQLLGLFGSTQKALGAADRVYAFLDEKPAVQERLGALPPENVAGEVIFDQVSFAYRAGQPVLQEVEMIVPPGAVVALVGPSGAGKTTLMSLLSRFYDPTEGRVLLDGHDLRDLTVDGLRDQIGIVFQDTFLFATTVRENITLGRTDVSEDQVMAAARAANAWEFVERLPDKLDTLVGERGHHLSEGQKQRVAIARALLRNPRILILDEPTSALDARSEHLLQSALDNLMRGRTTFVIAHRLATVQRANRIVVLDEGRIAEHGSHVELLRRGGLYRELFDLQFGHKTALPETEVLTISA